MHHNDKKKLKSLDFLKCLLKPKETKAGNESRNQTKKKNKAKQEIVCQPIGIQL